MTLTPQDVTEILKHLENSQCEEFHLQLGDTSLTLRRGIAGDAPPLGGAPAPRPAAPAAPEPATRPAGEANAQGAPGHQPEPAQPAADPGGDAIVAPLGGTFYRRPSPEEPPYVEEGDTISEGDPVCMIEVMKLFSTVYAERSGRVVAVLAEDADTVEQNQPLFRIEPA